MTKKRSVTVSQQKNLESTVHMIKFDQNDSLNTITIITGSRPTCHLLGQRSTFPGAIASSLVPMGLNSSPAWLPLAWSSNDLGELGDAMKFARIYHWIGLREILQETILFLPLNIGFSCKFSPKPIH